MPEMVGQRIARYRERNGWTQEQLAERIAISRVAVSHIEMGLSTPSERTIALMASVFKRNPHDLVSGTTYSLAKAERLPHTVAWFTEREFQSAMLKRDLKWLKRISDTPGGNPTTDDIIEEWLSQVSDWLSNCFDHKEREELYMLRRMLIDYRSSP